MKMATATETACDLSDIADGSSSGACVKQTVPSTPGACATQTIPSTNGSNSKETDNVVEVTDEEISENPEKFFESLSSKIEDQLRMLEWEMSSNFQEVAISDFLGNGICDDNPFAEDAGSFFIGSDTSYSYGRQRRCRSGQQDEYLKQSHDYSMTSSVSSMSSILDDDDKTSDIGADGDVENNTSESSRSNSCDSGSNILSASIMLVDRGRGNKQTVDFFVSDMVNAIMRDISTIFTDDRDAMLWTKAYDANLVPTLSTSYNQEHHRDEVDKNISNGREVLFSKIFSGDHVSFSDDRWFPHDEASQFSPAFGSYRSGDQATSSTSASGKRRSNRQSLIDENRSDEPERRIFHRARYQMHDIHHDLRRLKNQLHDVRDDRDESSDALGEF